MKQHRKFSWIAVLIFNFVLYNVAYSSPVFVPSINTGNGRNIRHLPCITRTGETGVCMFAITCAKANGTHLGTCIDRFYFGSCCKLSEKLDSYPHDNIIDLENSITQSKPFITTTIATTKTNTIRTTDSNDVPGNIDKFKPSGRPDGEAITKVTGTKVWSDFEKTQIKTGPTTESIRLSTFQTVQNSSDSKPISHEKPAILRPKPTFTYFTSGATSTLNSTTLPSSTVSYSSIKSSSSSTYPSSSVTSKRPPNVTSKRPTSVTSKRPILNLPVSENPASIFESTTKPSFNKTVNYNDSTLSYQTIAFTSSLPLTHKTSLTEASTKPQITITTTQKTPLITRFPPRNVTLITTIQETNTLKSTTVVNTHVKNTTDIQKQQTTRKPVLSKKPTKITSKKPPLTTVKSTSVANTSFNISVTTTKPLSITTPVTTSSVSSETKKSNTTATTIWFTTNNNITTIATSKPFTVDSSFKKPSTTVKKPLTSVTKKPSLITTSQVVTTTDKRPTSTILKKNSTTLVRPTITNSFKPTSTTRKQTTTLAPMQYSTSSIKSSTIATVNKATSTKKPTNPSTAFDGIAITTTATPLVYTIPSTTPKSNTVSHATNIPILESVVQLTTTVSPPSTYQVNKVPLTALPTSTISNEIESTINNQTPVMPGIVTWTSFSEDFENSTKATTSSPIISDSVESNWITSPDGWIIIQSPSSEKIETVSNSEHLASVNISFTEAEKPVTEQATTNHGTASNVYLDTTQTTTVVDVLSTLATITVSPEYTDKPTSLLNMSNFKEVCGRRLFPESRIVGGDGSTFAKWPWQISLRQWRTSTYLHKCGAALLNENWAITAAHCVQNVLPSDLLLRIGEHDLGNEEEPYGFQERRVQIVASHPNFDPRTFEFDLALMRFYEPVLPFQPNVLPICIPDDDEDYVGQTAFVTGWGRLYEDGPLPSILQEVAVPVINNSVCEGMYRNAGYIEHIPHIFICAGWRKGGFDSCEGDSGGPLVIQRKRDKRWVLAGVISWGIGCAEPNQPGVYTRISEFREWINQILQF